MVRTVYQVEFRNAMGISKLLQFRDYEAYKNCNKFCAIYDLQIINISYLYEKKIKGHGWFHYATQIRLF